MSINYAKPQEQQEPEQQQGPLPQPEPSTFLQRWGRELGNFGVGIGETVKALTVGPSEEYKRNFERGTRVIAESLPVRSGINKSIAIADTFMDFYAGATQGVYDIVGAEDAAREVREQRRKGMAARDNWDQFNAEQNKNAAVGEYWANIFMGADESITTSVAASATGVGLPALSNYYAVQATQDSLRKNPDNVYAAGMHGITEGFLTRYLGGKLQPSTAKLAGAEAAEASKLYARAVAKAKSATGLDKPIEALAGLTGEVIEELAVEAGHYSVDVGAGLEQFSWETLGTRLRDAAVAAAVTAGAAEGISAGSRAVEGAPKPDGIGDLIAKMQERETLVDAELSSELDTAERTLAEQELAQQEVPDGPGNPEEKAAAQAEAQAKMEAELAAQKEKTPEQRLQEFARKKAAAEKQKAKQNQVKSATVVEQNLAAEASQQEPNRENAELSALPAATLEAKDSSPILHDPEVETEFNTIAEMEAEIAQLRADIETDEGLAAGTWQEQKARGNEASHRLGELAEMEAALAARVDQLIAKVSGKGTKPKRTAAERRIEMLQARAIRAEARVKEVREATKQKAKDKQALVDDAVSYIKEAVPPSQWGKLLVRANNVKTESGLSKFLDAADKVIADHNHRLARKRFDAVIGRVGRAGLDANERAQLEATVSPIDMTPPKRRKQIEETAKFLVENPDADMPPGFADELKILDKKPFGELSTAELNGLAHALSTIAEHAENRNNFLSFAHNATIDSYANDIRTEIADNRPRQRSKLGMKLSSFANAIYRPEDIQGALSEKLRRMIWENIGVDAHREYMRLKNDVTQQAEQFMGSIGLNPARSLDTLGQGGSRLQAWRDATRSIGGVSMTRAEALHLHLMSLDPDARARMLDSGVELDRTADRPVPKTLEVTEGEPAPTPPPEAPRVGDFRVSEGGTLSYDQARRAADLVADGDSFLAQREQALENAIQAGRDDMAARLRPMIERERQELDDMSARIEQVRREGIAAISDDEKDLALVQYMENSNPVNRALRSGELSDRDSLDVLAIDAALDSMESAERTVHRGVSFENEADLIQFLAQMQPGAEWSDAAYLSSTEDESEAMRYAREGIADAQESMTPVSGQREHGVVLKMASKSGVQLPDIGLPFREVLHKRGTKWKVDSIQTRDDGTSVVEMSELDPAPAALSNVGMSDGTFREIQDFIGPQGLQLADHIFGQVNTRLRDAVNAAWEQVHGVPLSLKNDYFPTQRVEDWVKDGATPEEFFEQFQQATLESARILKERTGGSAPLRLRDALDVYSQHIDMAARVSAYLAPARDAHNVLVHRKDVKDAIISASSEDVYNGILRSIGLQVMPQVDSSWASTAARRLVRGSGASILGLQFTTPFYNLLGPVVAAGRMSNGGSIMQQAIRDVGFLVDKKALDTLEAKARENSPYWTERYREFTSEVTSGVFGKSRAFMPPGAERIFMKHIEATDKFARLVQYRMAELALERNQGLSPDDPTYNEQVAKEWERMVYRSDSTGHGLEMSGVIRAGREHGLAAAIAQFESGATKGRSLLFAAKVALDQGRNKDAVRAASSAAIASVIIAAVRQMGRAARGSDDEEFGHTLAQSVISEQFSIAGPFINKFYRGAMGMQVWTGSNNVLVRMGEDTSSALALAGKAVNQAAMGDLDDEGDPAYRDTAIKAVGKLQALIGAVTHLPVVGAAGAMEIFENLSGQNVDELEQIKADIRAAQDEYASQTVDTGPAKRAMYEAMQRDDSNAFLQAMVDMYLSNPAKFNGNSIRSVVDSQPEFVAFRQTQRFLRQHPEQQLTPKGQAWFEATEAAYKEQLETLSNMASQNLGAMRKLTGR